jgi:hypothetical protein
MYYWFSDFLFFVSYTLYTLSSAAYGEMKSDFRSPSETTLNLVLKVHVTVLIKNLVYSQNSWPFGKDTFQN